MALCQGPRASKGPRAPAADCCKRRNHVEYTCIHAGCMIPMSKYTFKRKLKAQFCWMNKLYFEYYVPSISCCTPFSWYCSVYTFVLLHSVFSFFFSCYAFMGINPEIWIWIPDHFWLRFKGSGALGVGWTNDMNSPSADRWPTCVTRRVLRTFIENIFVR